MKNILKSVIKKMDINRDIKEDVLLEVIKAQKNGELLLEELSEIDQESDEYKKKLFSYFRAGRTLIQIVDKEKLKEYEKMILESYKMNNLKEVLLSMEKAENMLFLDICKSEA